MAYLRILIPIAFIFLIPACSTLKKTVTHSVSHLRFIDVYEIPVERTFKETTIGGLSGIDYDVKKDLYYLVCDDRSDVNPSRFYTARIKFSDKSIDTVIFQDVVTLLDKDKRPYPNLQSDPERRIDPEGIRYNPTAGKLYWSNEGERSMYNGKMVLSDPAITIIDRNGQYIDTFILPGNLHVHATENGLRRNGGFEGLSFDNNYKFLYASVEEPIYEDGPRAGLGDTTGWIRLVKFDSESRRQVAQFAYRIDAIPYPASPADAFKLNGVSEILYIGNDNLLIIERAFSTGRLSCVIKIYLADLAGATDVSSVTSLQASGDFKPIAKKLLLNMEDLGKYIDNVEGLTFGPRLPNGHASLLLVADDNFSPTQRTQFWLLEVIP